MQDGMSTAHDDSFVCSLQLLFTMAVIAETEEELIKRLNEWKDNVESKGMRVNMRTCAT